MNRLSLSDKIYYSRGIPLCQQNFRKKFEKFSNAENYFQNRRKSTLFPRFVFGFWRHEKLPPFGKFRQPAENFLLFLQRCYASTSCTLPRPSLRMERALRSGRWDSFSAEKPRRLKHATGMFLRAAFRIPPSVKNKDHPDGWSLFGGEGGFEPTWRVTANSISSRARYDHFDTSPYRACLTGAYLFYHAMTENTSAFSEIVIIFISPGRHPADNGLPHSGKA